MQKQIVKIMNSTGLHARPAMLLVRSSNTFLSEIAIYSEHDKNNRANTKSITSLCAMGLTPGTNIIVEATGPDEAEAVKTIVALLSSLKD